MKNTRATIPLPPRLGCIFFSRSLMKSGSPSTSLGGVVEDAPVLPNRAPGAVVNHCPLKATLTTEQASEQFRKLADAPNIPFDYPVDCCYSRAHAMCAMLEKAGFISEKYFFYRANYPAISQAPFLCPVKEDGARVAFPDENGVEQPVQWVYHVAPLVSVKDKDGQVEKMVLDPSIADKPVTQAQWRAIQGNPAGATESVTDWKVCYAGPGGMNPTYDNDLQATNLMMAAHTLRREANITEAIFRKLIAQR
jgi:hypothetical protein